MILLKSSILYVYLFLIVSYFMRRHNSYDLLYDEQILTRGYDDVSLIQNLVNDGYIFHLLLDGYFIDTSLNKYFINT